MLQPIRTQEDLPQEGATYESLRYDFKETIDPSNRRELAKDVASFANATGGVIIVGSPGLRGQGATELRRSGPRLLLAEAGCRT